jgi:ATP-binding cassette subfamily F protein 3
MSDAYQQHKARNIRVRTRSAIVRSSQILIEVSGLSLGYDYPLFADVSFQLREGDKLRLHGRNGAGKTTLVKAVLADAASAVLASTIFAGEIKTAPRLKVGVYEQEIHTGFLGLTLAEAVEQSFMRRGLPVNDQKVRQMLGDYLFDPISDARIEVGKLSGGQKARFQLIQMLADDPQVLILDEPTNHLDLPSIEELEDALKQYHGAILYISHDSYFVRNLGGETVPVGSVNTN